MANKGNTRHMIALASPVFIAIKRKEQPYVAKPNPGRHVTGRAITLQLVVQKLGFAGTAAEAKRLVKNGLVSVNGKAVGVPYFPVGPGDTIAVTGNKSAFRIIINKYAKIDFEEVEKPDYDSLLFRVNGKYKAGSGILMLRLHDGSAVRGSNDAHVNDSVIIDAKRSVKRVLQLKEGAECIVINGVHVGATGSIKSLKPGNMRREGSVIIRPKSGDEFETITKNIMVTGSGGK